MRNDAPPGAGGLGGVRNDDPSPPGGARGLEGGAASDDPAALRAGASRAGPSESPRRADAY